MKKAKIDWQNHIIELIVVFIGITLAFMLNNWRENHSDRLMAEKYINSFRNDISYDHAQLDSIINSNEDKLERIGLFITSLKNKNPTIEDAERIMGDMAEINPFIPKINTYESIKNSGNLNLLTNYDIREKLIQYYQSFEEKKQNGIQENLICRFLKCELLFQQGTYEDLLNIAEKAYQDSLLGGLNSLSFDFLMWKARALIYLFRMDDVPNVITQGEQQLQEIIHISQAEFKQREATLAFVKGLFIFWEKRDINLALEQLNHSLALRVKLGTKPEIVSSNMQIAKVLVYGKGDFSGATKYLEYGMTLAKKINNKYNIAWGLQIMAVMHCHKGELNSCIQLNKQSLKLYKELDNKYMIANVLNNLGGAFILKGDLDQALNFVGKRLKLRSNSGSIREIAVSYDA